MQGLLRGNGAHVIRLLPEVGLRFALNEQLRIMFSPLDGRPIGREGKLMAGATTGEHPRDSATAPVSVRAMQALCRYRTGR